MSSICKCSVCGRPTDCGDTVCSICECQSIGESPCPDGKHCDRIVREVKPNLFVIQKEDSSYSLKWIPSKE